MRMRIMCAAGLGSLLFLAVATNITVSGQERAHPPALVITAFGGKPVTYKAPRTPWGDPDLQGVWSSDDMENVPMAAGGGRGGARGAGAAAAAGAPGQVSPLYLDEQALAARQKQVTQTSTDRDDLAVSTFRWDYARRAFPQTRLIVDPPDGRLPGVKAEAQQRLMPRGTFGNGPLDSPEDFSLYERCITRGIAGSVLRVIYGNGNRIVQAPGVVAFGYEMLPDTRIIYTDGRPHIGRIQQYLGDSRGRWEGEELVVETTNLTDRTAVGVNGNGVRHSAQMKITERFRRVAADVIQYQATFDDPLTYDRPFTISFPLTPLDGGVLLPYECHPGNTALSLALAAERAEDKAMAEAAAKGIKRQRRGVQEGADAAAPPLLDRATGRGGSQGSGARALTVGAATGEDTQEK